MLFVTSSCAGCYSNHSYKSEEGLISTKQDENQFLKIDQCSMQPLNAGSVCKIAISPIGNILGQVHSIWPVANSVRARPTPFLQNITGRTQPRSGNVFT